MKKRKQSKPSSELLTRNKKSRRLIELPSLPKNLNKDSRRRGRNLSFRRSRKTIEIYLTQRWLESLESSSSTKSKTRSLEFTLKCKNKRRRKLESLKRKKRKLKELERPILKSKGSRKSRRRWRSRSRTMTLSKTSALRSRLKSPPSRKLKSKATFQAPPVRREGRRRRDLSHPTRIFSSSGILSRSLRNRTKILKPKTNHCRKSLTLETKNCPRIRA